jgi:hypothetical protein
MKDRLVLAAWLLITTVGLGFRSVAWGVAIDPGFDLFATDPGTTFVKVDTDPTPNVVLVDVPLKGVPIGPGDTDTIVQRKGSLAAAMNGPIPIELVALSLESVSPVNIGGTNFNLRILGGDMLIPQSSPDGSMQVMDHPAVDLGGGGTFTSILPVVANLIFTEVGNPANTFTMPFSDTLSGSGIWGHTPRLDDPHNDQFPAGHFFPGVDPQTGAKRLTIEVSLLAQHGVLPAQIPEPTTLLLVSSALAGLASAARRRPR